MNRYLKISCLFLMASLLTALPLRAVSQHWTGNAGQNFTDSGNWDPGSISVYDDFFVDVVSETSCPIYSDAYSSINKLQIGVTDGGYAGPGQVIQIAGTTFYVNDEMAVGGSGSTTGNSYYTLNGGALVKTTLGDINVGYQGGLGQFNISGGAGVTMDTGQIFIGNQGGTGQFNLTGGSSVIMSSGGAFDLGCGSGSNGTATIADTASLTLTNGQILVGDSGAGTIAMTGGTLSLSGGGWLKIGANGSGSTGQFTMSGGTVTVAGDASNNQGLTLVGSGSGNTGHLDLSGGATFNHNANGDFIVGDSSGTGTMSMVGSAAGVTPVVTTKLNVAGATIRVGNAGTGTLTLGDNAVVNSPNYLVIGGGAAGNGKLTMTGNALITHTSASFFVGEGATGLATMADTSQINLSGGFDTVFGRAAGNGTVTMTGGTMTQTAGRFIVAQDAGSTGHLTMSGSAAVNVSGGGDTILGSSAGNGTVTMTGGTFTQNGGHVFVGQDANSIGNLTMSGNATFNSDVAFDVGNGTGSIGTLNVSGSATVAVAGGNIYFGDSGTGTLNLHGNAQINQSGGGFFVVGTSPATSGSFVGNELVVMGSLGNPADNPTINLTTTGGDGFIVGGGPSASAATSYGCFNLQSGTINGGTAPFRVSYNSVGVWNQTGGAATFNSSTNVINGVADIFNTVGIMNVTGGTFTESAPFTVGCGYGVLNIGGTGTVNLGSLLIDSKSGTRDGIVNLAAGGTLSVTSIAAGPNATTSTRVFGLAFHGGTLASNSTNNTNFLNLTSNGHVVIYSEGGTIDTTNGDVTISQALEAPAASGVTTIPVTSGGAGYLGTPAVTITGGSGAKGATAVANMSADGTTVVSITITNPGVYTAAPTAITLLGGGYTTAATLGAATIAANAATGGLTKIGAGTLTLTGANTYGGVTDIKAGTLSFAVNSLNSTSAIKMDGGALQWNGNSQDLSAKVLMVNDKKATFNTNNNDVIFGSAIGSNSSAALYKTGLGSLTLSVDATYTGDTIVNVGTLTARNINTPAAAVSVATGATLNATSITADTLTIGGGPFLAASAGATAVPEPGTLALLALAGLALAGAYFRRE